MTNNSELIEKYEELKEQFKKYILFTVESRMKNLTSFDIDKVLEIKKDIERIESEITALKQKAVNEICDKAELVIKPTYCSGVSTAVEVYHVVDQKGSIWFEGAYIDCQNYLKSKQ